MPTHWPSQRAQARAAIRHFMIAENAEGDFHVEGLDDDELIMNAVLEHFDMTPPGDSPSSCAEPSLAPNVCN